MRLRALGHWNDLEISALNVPKGQGYLVLKIDEEFRPVLAKELSRLKDKQVERFRKASEKDPSKNYEDCLIDIEVDFQFFYKKRSIDANNLLWALYSIEASWANNSSEFRNGYHSAYLPDHIITPMEIHDADCENWCEKNSWKVYKKDLFAFRRSMVLGDMGKVMKVEENTKEPDKLNVQVWKTTSFLTTKDMAEWITRVIERIKYSGLLQTDLSDFLMIRKQFQEILEKGERTK